MYYILILLKGKNMFHSQGKMVYEPYRPSLKHLKKVWWGVVEVDREITRYFRWFLIKQYNALELKNIILSPAFDAHFTVFCGHKDVIHNMDGVIRYWNTYHNQLVDFYYDEKIREVNRKGNVYFVVDIKCQQLLDLRKQMGLKTNWGFHLTVGKRVFNVKDDVE